MLNKNLLISTVPRTLTKNILITIIFIYLALIIHLLKLFLFLLQHIQLTDHLKINKKKLFKYNKILMKNNKMKNNKNK
jgi:hypothetical protein